MESHSYILFRKRATSSNGIAIVSNYTYKGRILHQDGSRILVQYYTDEYGHDITSHNLSAYIQPRDILSQGFSPTIDLNRIYTLNPVLTDTSLLATGYVNKSRSTNPLMKATDTGLGAGVYGVYMPPYMTVESFRQPLQLENPLILVDGVHGESLTLAARTLNIYLDRVLAVGKQISPEDLANLIADTLPPNIYQLWDMVFSRTAGPKITWDQLQNYCVRYVLNYFQTVDAIDSITSQPLQRPPINMILTSLGYDGIASSDRENNRRDRGCVSYRTTNVTNHYGYNSKY